MERFTHVTGIAAPLPMINVDTDTIIPKDYCKSVTRTGFGAHLFHDLRYFPDGRERPDFVLNRPPFRSASILVAGDNFGAGSSREAAVWALGEFGIRCIIAPSFADIFSGNCFQNGLLPVALAAPEVDRLMAQAETGAPLIVDLARQVVTAADGREITFVIDDYRRECLLNGLDEIGVTLTHAAEITAHEQRIDAERRWHRPARREPGRRIDPGR